MNTSSLTDWSNFGLAGMVIGALFALLWVSGKLIIRQFDKITIMYSDNLKQMNIEHTQERERWNQRYEDLCKRIEASLNHVAKAIEKTCE